MCSSGACDSTCPLWSPARLGVSEGCASWRSTLDKYKSLFGGGGGGGGEERGSLCYALLPELASGSSQHQLSCTSRVSGSFESSHAGPSVFFGLTWSLGSWWPDQQGACCWCWREPVSAPQPSPHQSFLPQQHLWAGPRFCRDLFVLVPGTVPFVSLREDRKPPGASLCL